VDLGIVIIGREEKTYNRLSKGCSFREKTKVDATEKLGMTTTL
jgi:hypothetical protein